MTDHTPTTSACMPHPLPSNIHNPSSTVSISLSPSPSPPSHLIPPRPTPQRRRLRRHRHNHNPLRFLNPNPPLLARIPPILHFSASARASFRTDTKELRPTVLLRHPLGRAAGSLDVEVEVVGGLGSGGSEVDPFFRGDGGHGEAGGVFAEHLDRGDDAGVLFLADFLVCGGGGEG